MATGVLKVALVRPRYGSCEKPNPYQVSNHWQKESVGRSSARLLQIEISTPELEKILGRRDFERAHQAETDPLNVQNEPLALG